MLLLLLLLLLLRHVLPHSTAPTNWWVKAVKKGPICPQIVGPHATCHLLTATCHLSPATCHLPPATCHLTPAASHLPPVNWKPGQEVFGQIIQLGLEQTLETAVESRGGVIDVHIGNTHFTLSRHECIYFHEKGIKWWTISLVIKNNLCSTLVAVSTVFDLERCLKPVLITAISLLPVWL